MCTNLQNGAFITKDWVAPHHVSSRTKHLDRKRIFFQGISSSHYPDKDDIARSDTDDEDLLDVLVSAQPDTGRDRKFNTLARSDLRPVAALLPSSRSGNLSGLIKQQDFERLIRLLVSVSLCESGIRPPAGVSWGEFTKDIVRVVLSMFLGQEKEIGIDWERFSSVISESLVYISLSH